MDYQRLLEYQNKCRYRNQLINQLNTDYPKLSSIYQYTNSKSYKRALGFFYTARAGIFGVLLLISVIVAVILYPQITYNSVIRVTEENCSMVFAFYLFVNLAILFCVLFFVQISLGITFNNKQRYIYKTLPVLEENCKNNSAALEKIEAELSEYDLLPYNYFFAGECIIQYILNRRADSIKEAINLFEAERFRNAQFQYQMQQLQMLNQQISQTNRRIRNNGIANALGSVAIASAIGLKRL